MYFPAECCGNAAVMEVEALHRCRGGPGGGFTSSTKTANCRYGRAAATPKATAATRPLSNPRGLAVKVVTNIAKPATTAAMRLKVEVISSYLWAFLWALHVSLAAHHNSNEATAKSNRPPGEGGQAIEQKRNEIFISMLWTAIIPTQEAAIDPLHGQIRPLLCLPELRRGL
jgi:hypothetical protein